MSSPGVDADTGASGEVLFGSTTNDHKWRADDQRLRQANFACESATRGAVGKDSNARPTFVLHLTC